MPDRITFERAALLDALTLVAKVKPWQREIVRMVPNMRNPDGPPTKIRENAPALVRIETLNGGKAIIGTANLAMSIATTISCEATGEIEAYLPLSQIIAAVQKAVKSVTQIVLEVDGDQTTVLAGRFRAVMRGEEINAAPNRPPVDGADFRMPIPNFREGLRIAAPAVSDDAKQYFLNGVNLRDVGGGAMFVGRDQNRAHQLAGLDTVGGADMILPDDLCALLLATMPEDGLVELRFDQRTIEIVWPAIFRNTTVRSALIDGQFPQPVTPEPLPTDRIFCVSARQFLEDLDLVATVADPKTRDIRLDLGAECEASAFRLGGDAGAIRLVGIFIGEPIAIGFQFGLLRDALAAFGDAEIELRMRSNREAAVITSRERPGVRATVGPISLVSDHLRVLA